MTSLRKVLLSSACIVLTGGVFTSAHAETLQEAVGQALNAHPSIEAALQAREIARETKREQRSGYFPEISANASGGRIYGDNSTSRGLTVSRGATYSGLGEAGATLTQPLFDGFETSNRVKAADARMQSEEYNIADAREQLAYQAVQAYWGLFHSQRLLNKVKSYKETIEDYLGRIEMMVDEGAADESEASQARNVILDIETSIIDYEGQVRSALANYRQIMGVAPRSALHEPLSVHHIIPASPEEALSMSQGDHPILMSLDREMAASEFDEKAERGVLFPDIDGELSVYKKDQKEEIGGEVEDRRALIKMNWVFNTGGAQFARMDRAKAERSELLARKGETLRQIEGDVRRAYAEMVTAAKQMRVIESRKEVTQELLDAYEVQFEGGRVRLLQLMQSESQVFNVDVERLDADYRYKLAEFAVLAAMGKLNTHLAEVPVVTQAVYEPQKKVNEPEAPEIALESPMLSDAPQEPQQTEEIQSVNHAVLEARIYTGAKY